MAYTISTDEGKVTVVVSGKLDAVSAPGLESELLEVLEGATGVTFDFDGLEYISSAGLRLMLIAYKRVSKSGDVHVVNASGDVKEMLKMTGFAEIFEA